MFHLFNTRHVLPAAAAQRLAQVGEAHSRRALARPASVRRRCRQVIYEEWPAEK